nr:kinesin-like protein KIN12A [Ipomoea batatas]
MRRMYFNQLGWIPLVKDALAGYNTSLLAYGHVVYDKLTGSGKTYTLWGPPSAMVETPSTNRLQGIVPRIFQMLFDNIQRVYNGHIGYLLDPMQRNLKDDTKNGFYVENLTEEYVSTYEDVTQILIKGLSSRKVGSTGVNSKSSRSHGVFTCIVESWRKLLEWNGNRDCEQEIVKEIQGEPYTDDPMNKSTERARSSSLLQSIQLGKSGAYAKGCSEKELEAERQRWTEMESEWISLTDELRIDLESIRQRAEKVEMELKLEKCTE